MLLQTTASLQYVSACASVLSADQEALHAHGCPAPGAGAGSAPVRKGSRQHTQHMHPLPHVLLHHVLTVVFPACGMFLDAECEGAGHQGAVL
jgi:hypothetical protein